ncbi:MAG: hypothetical protein D6776_01085 [Planctomycetota bacterium]|nr:MAG: hypothetical protein D6776_01085 [Planctomycetota bacterium]
MREGRQRGARVSCEVTPHHLLLTDEAVRGFDAASHKMNPPLRPESDREALIEGLHDGTIDCIASDHAPHPAEEKEREWDLAPCGVIGLETTLPVLYTGLVEPGLLALPRLIELLTIGPVRCLGLDHPSQLPASPGTLARGGVADVTVFDTRESFIVGAPRFFSRSANSPFRGQRARGRVAWTIVGGHIAYDRERDEPPSG